MPMPLKRPQPSPRRPDLQPHRPRRPLPPFRPHRTPTPAPKPFKFAGPLYPNKKFGQKSPFPVNPYKQLLTGKGLAKLAARAIPGLGWALLAYDIFEYLNEYATQHPNYQRVPKGYTLGGVCPIGKDDLYFVFNSAGCGGFNLPSPENLAAARYAPMIIGGNDVPGEPSAFGKLGDVTSWWFRDATPDPWIPPYWQPVPNEWVDPLPTFPEIPFELLPHRRNIEEVYEHWYPKLDIRAKDPPTVSITPDGQKREIPRQHVRSKPGRNEKEVKGKHSSWEMYNLLRNVFHGLTEVGDIVDAIYKALPGDIRRTAPKKQNMADKMRFIYANAEHLDLHKMVFNIAANHLEDAIVGKGFQKLQDASNNLGVPGSGFRFYNPII